MADQHPYVSGTGGLVKFLDHLKRSFPTTLDADLLRKLGLAPRNESYLLNTVRFLNLIDENGARTPHGHKTFTLHDQESFQRAFSEMVKAAYKELFALYGDSAWELDQAKLITFFRQADQSSEVVGQRQAQTFRTLAAYAGKVESQEDAKQRPAPREKSKTKPRPPREGGGQTAQQKNRSGLEELDQLDRKVALTFRIEINLPAQGDQETYDRIFKSIREHLLNG